MKQRRLVYIFLLMVLFVHGCGGGDKETSDSITFISESKIYLKESDLETFKFRVQAESELSSRLVFQLKGEGDGKYFILTPVDGILSFNDYYYTRGEKKSTYEIDVVASVLEGTIVNNNTTILHKQSSKVSQKQHITILIGDKPKSTSLLANAGLDISTTVNQAITLRGTASNSEGKVIEYEWKNEDKVLATTAIFEYLPTVIGRDKLTLTVTDENGVTSSDSVVVTVNAIETSSLSKWITPTRNICESNDGEYGEEEDIPYCKAKWNTSKAICTISGGELPSVEILREVVTDCGGTMGDYTNNKNSEAYQACYKEKGFTSKGYWSSTKNPAGVDYNMWWYVYFDNGFNGGYENEFKLHIRCLKLETFSLSKQE